ncbi:hypothetical protein [uncultured Gilvimarinus sp.]|uniref:hypothetical protein n=1 Tax=uncultured Gilvimarinus sp. TaxID=1689143 RepID=UPI0030DB846B
MNNVRKYLLVIPLAFVLCLGFCTQVLAESFDDLFSSKMGQAQHYISNKQYQEALEVVNHLREAMDDDVGAVEMAYVYNFQRYSLYELDRIDEAENVCKKSIKDLEEYAFEWQYSAEYNVVRSTLRACYNMVAWQDMERAQSVGELTDAIYNIESGFYTVGATEDDTVVDELRETDALIYLKAYGFDKSYINKAYSKLLFFSENKSFLDSADQKIKDALVSDWFKNYTLPDAPEQGSLKSVPKATPVPREVMDELVQLASQCKAANMADCDTLYHISLADSEQEAYAASCGGRVRDKTEFCVDYAKKHWQDKTPSGKKVPRKLSVNAATKCFDGDLSACDTLYYAAAGSQANRYARTCGGRFEWVDSPCSYLLKD